MMRPDHAESRAPAPPGSCRAPAGVDGRPECAPLAKTGGLGDAVAGLAKALRQAGCDVRVVLPFYANIPRAAHRVASEGAACVHMGGGVEH